MQEKTQPIGGAQKKGRPKTSPTAVIAMTAVNLGQKKCGERESFFHSPNCIQATTLIVPGFQLAEQVIL